MFIGIFRGGERCAKDNMGVEVCSVNKEKYNTAGKERRKREDI